MRSSHSFSVCFPLYIVLLCFRAILLCNIKLSWLSVPRYIVQQIDFEKADTCSTPFQLFARSSILIIAGENVGRGCVPLCLMYYRLKRSQRCGRCGGRYWRIVCTVIVTARGINLIGSLPPSGRWASVERFQVNKDYQSGMADWWDGTTRQLIDIGNAVNLLATITAASANN